MTLSVRYVKEKYGVRLLRAKFVAMSLFLLLIVVLSAEIQGFPLGNNVKSRPNHLTFPTCFPKSFWVFRAIRYKTSWAVTAALLGGYLCHQSEFQNLSFPTFRRKLCLCWYFTIVFLLNFLWPFRLTLCHLSPILLSHVAFLRPCRFLDFTLTAPCYISVSAQLDKYLFVL